jgi:hypothetical protein
MMEILWKRLIYAIKQTLYRKCVGEFALKIVCVRELARSMMVLGL